MANTVNDVMNVIASPDYGIKNIACTNQEILAILQGNHNSKYNLHNIVNDVKNILQKLVDSSTKSKSIEISNGSTKINNHIQDILDETKGIRKSIDNLAKEFLKRGGNNMPTIAKLSDKASQKVADAMIQDIDKHNKGGGLSTIVDAFNKLKNISLKDIIVGKQKVKLITKIFGNAKKELNIEENELNNVIKLINNTPEIMKSLLKVSRKITKIIKRDVINKLSEILVGKNSILTISKKLQKNETLFDNAQKIAKNIKELVLALNKVIFKLFSASLFAKFSEKGISNIESIIDKLSSLSKKLIKIKDIEKGKETAKQMTVLTGNLLVTSIFLTISAVTGGPALLGAIILNKMVDKIIPVVEKLSKNNKHINKSIDSSILLTACTGLMAVTSIILATIAVTGIPALLGAIILNKMIDKIIPVVEKLSKNNKHINKAIDSSILLTACTGLMAVTSIILATIAVTGIPALLGSILMVGIVKLNIYTFKLLSKAQKPISKGAIVMSIMSVSLILYGIALKKISDATKNMDFKQIAIITSITLILSGTIIGLGYLIIPIGLGSMALGLMGVSLISYGIALKKISDATKSLTMENIVLVSESMLALGKAVAKMAILTVPITLGGVALGIMGVTLYTFVKTLKIISDMNDVPTKKVYQILTAMKLVGNFFKNNKLGLKSVWNANKYKLIMRPFAGTIKHLSKLKDMGIIPMKLVYGALNAMSSIANYYIENPIEKSVIKQARRYKRMLKPFGKTIDNLSKLKNIGIIPMKLVYSTLNAMNSIANYYIENPIEKSVIKQARRYKRMLKPFGKTINHLSKLKDMGIIPMKLVYGALNAMSSIANYYIENPIEKSVIKQARRYKRMLKPFSKTINHLTKLKDMGIIPMKLVYGVLNAMSSIANYYIENPIEKSVIKQARRYKRMLKPFGKTIDNLSKLKDLGTFPLTSVKNIVESLYYISNFYEKVNISDNIESKSEFIKYIVDKFNNMSVDIQDKLTNIKEIDYKTVKSIISSCRSIMDYYTYTKTFFTIKKVLKMNNAVNLFSKNVEYLKNITNNFTKSNFESVKLIVKSMKRIINFLKFNSLNIIQRKRAEKNITLLNLMSSAMHSISNINSSNILSVGDALINTLNGVNTIDIGQVESVTNMFKAFDRINRSENIINKFTESVKQFTTACENLIDNLSRNTDAINNIDTFGIDNTYTNIISGNNIIDNKSNNNNVTQTNGIKIINVDEIAKTIAEKINGSLTLDIPDTQVQLLINGSGGNEWTITRY